MNVLRRLLHCYAQSIDTDENETWALFDAFMKTGGAFLRSEFPGHFTASAAVVNGRLDKVCLVFHKRLNKWLQPGGHADGNRKLDEVALREVMEETGLTALSLLPGDCVEIFDLDRHSIPENRKEPAHFHYDVRFLIQADDSQPLVVSNESHAVAWFSLTEARRINFEQSLMRLWDKIEALRAWQ